MPQFRSNENPMFRSKFSEDIFKHKYAHHGCETWDALSSVLVDDVCKEYLSKDDRDALKRMITDLKFIPDRKSTRLNSSHGYISYAVFCLKKKKPKKKPKKTKNK